MDRFKAISDARFPGKVIDLWSDFTFYCYDSEKVVEHLNKILNKDKEGRLCLIPTRKEEGK